MEKLQKYINSLTDDQINEIYHFYDSGGYDHLMRYPSTVVPRLDMNMRRKYLFEYLSEYIDNPDPDVPSKVLDGSCTFEDFRYTLQNQCIGEPLMHRINQNTHSSELGCTNIVCIMNKENMKEETRGMEECLKEVLCLLKETMEPGRDPPYIYSDEIDKNDQKVRKAIELIEDYFL